MVQINAVFLEEEKNMQQLCDIEEVINTNKIDLQR